MKKKVFYLAFLLLGLAVVSCKEDNNMEPQPERRKDNPLKAESLAYLMEGDFMYRLTFECPAAQVTEYETRKLTDYSELQFSVVPDIGESANFHTPEEFAAYDELKNKYCAERMAIIVDAYEEYGHRDPNAWPQLYSTYTSGEVSLTCDKTLFGQEPGTDLSPYFRASSDNLCSVVGAEEMTLLYDFGEEAPANMRDYFPVGVWLACEYTVKPISCPKEKYDRLTFHLSIPVHSEHIGDYIWAKVFGRNLPLRAHDTVLEADCEVEFAWE